MQPVLDNIESSDFFRFVAENSLADPASLLLMECGKSHDFDLDFAVVQIECRRRCERKLPSFLANRGFLFPDSISAEQASNEFVSAYHADLLGGGEDVLDMTAGLGIDSMTLARRAGNVVAVELDIRKAEVLHHNAACMGIENYTVVCGDSLDFIKSLERFPEVIFVDPARRGDNKRRTYSFADCSPDVTSFLDFLIGKDCRVLIKASPLLDVTGVVRQLNSVAAIHLVCVKGECKELLVDARKDASDPEVIVADLSGNGEISRFGMHFSELGNSQAPVWNSDTPLEGNYLYEPNAGMQKLAAADKLTRIYPGLRIASRNAGVFIASTLYPDFPGRIFGIDSRIRKGEYRLYSGGQYNVAVRNYPMGADDLRRKLKLKEGRDSFVFGLRLGLKGEPVLLAVERLRPGSL